MNLVNTVGLEVIQLVQDAVDVIDGKVVGYLLGTGRFTIEVPPNTVADLQTMGQFLVDSHPELFSSFGLTRGSNMPIEYMLREEPSHYPFRADSINYMALNTSSVRDNHAIANFPQAWAYFGTQERSGVVVGVIDAGFMPNHASLNIPAGNIINPLNTPNLITNHGTAVMGIIAAQRNEQRNMSGGINLAGNNLFGHMFRGGNYFEETVLDALEWLVDDNHARVINASIGRYHASSYEFSIAMYQLRQQHDFIVVQAANNSTTNARNDALFAHDSDRFADMPLLMSSTITVSDINNTGQLGQGGWGAFVDVVAPGVDIYAPRTYRRAGSSDIGDGITIFGYHTGTSFATPHVTALAALIWDEFPTLSGAQVKDAIANSAVSFASDTRSSVPAAQRRDYPIIDAYSAMHRAADTVTAATSLTGHVVTAVSVMDHIMLFPIAGARVVAVNANNHDCIFVTYTNTSGHYRIPGIQPGAYNITVSPIGYISEILHGVDVSPGIANVYSPRMRLVPVRDDISAANAGGNIYLDTISPQIAETEPISASLPNLGEITLTFRRGINNLHGEIAYTAVITGDRFDTSLPPGNYTVTASGPRIETTTSNIISFWADGDDYWLRQNIFVRALPGVCRDITHYFECPEFLRFVRDNLDITANAPIYCCDIADVLSIFLDGFFYNVSSIAGIEHFISLQTIFITRTLLDSLDLSNNPQLLEFNAFLNSQLTSLDISNYLQLQELNLWSNRQLTGLSVSNNPQLLYFWTNNDQLTSLDIFHNPQLSRIDVHRGQLTSLDLSNNPLLSWIQVIYNNQLSSLDISNNPQLRELNVWSNRLTSLDVSSSPQLQSIDAGINQLTDLDISNNPHLLDISVVGNRLTSLDLSNNPLLSGINVSGNRLTSLDLSNNPQLFVLSAGHNQLTNLDLSNNTQLIQVFVNNNRLTSLNVSNNPELWLIRASSNQLTALDVSNTQLLDLSISRNQMASPDAITGMRGSVFFWPQYTPDGSLIWSPIDPTQTDTPLQPHQYHYYIYAPYPDWHESPFSIQEESLEDALRRFIDNLPPGRHFTDEGMIIIE